MTIIQRIKILQAEGASVSAIAKAVGVDRKTVSKYLTQTDFSPQPPTTTGQSSKLDPYKPTIDQWLHDDQAAWYKQRHTAQRVHDRLHEQFPEYQLSYSTVRRYVKAVGQVRPTTGTLDLIWHPGEAQVDFGQADAILAGERTRLHFLCLSFPYSNAAYVQWFRGETAECVVQGLADLFQHMGGAPVRLVFDNATGVGRRVGAVVQLTDLFGRFQAHYGFEVTFCNPYAGYEKGHVENKVGFFRRNLFVPLPVIDDLVTANVALLTESEVHWATLHYQKGKSIRALFGEDRLAFRGLPPQPFAPYRYTRVRTTRQGAFCLDGAHWYSSSPEQAEQLLQVRIGAHTVEPFDATGRILTTHARRYGPIRSDSIDYRTTVHRVAERPGAWRNSGLREVLPEDLRSQLDHLVRADLQSTLRALAQCTDRWGWDHAVRALDEAVRLHRSAPTDVLAIAAYLALMPAEQHAEGPDLTIYDQFLRRE